ncbi:MAG TPA: aspartate-semialdehyde dehydrogenase [Clostridiaceae bacterium]|jgi:aspartate-semialdehyde dehydrogenase|nr:aspartate-semialdehyde dehydrogenase [Clostridiaceae bacterium]
MDNKLKVGIIGATGMVGQRFVSLLGNHPWFEVTCVAASERSAGKKYSEAVKGRWFLSTPIPSKIGELTVENAAEVEKVSNQVDFVFCAVDMDKEQVKKLEEAYAKTETPVVSNNSAHRWTMDVPMLIPEVNYNHLKVIEIQKKRLGTKKGFIAVKPNCSIQSYVPAIHPLFEYNPIKIMACTYQAISGAGKTFETWPEIIDNVIPFIKGEEEKSEKEPLKIWGSVAENGITTAEKPVISAQCIRVPVSDGHLAAVSVIFETKPSKSDILRAWEEFEGKPQKLGLPNAPKKFIKYLEDESRPQTHLDRDFERGMGITVGRLREDPIFDYKFVCLSHNTLRGAAGGAVLIAELLKAEGYLERK